MNITCIDNSDFAGRVATRAFSDALHMKNTKDMVNKILAKLGKGKIDRLNIIDHGTKMSIQIGVERLFDSSYPLHKELARLKGRFSKRGFVHLMQCHAGAAIPLLKKLAAAFGVPVYASTGRYYELVYIQGTPFGEYVRVAPDGTLTTNVARP